MGKCYDRRMSAKYANICEHSLQSMQQQLGIVAFALSLLNESRTLVRTAATSNQRIFHFNYGVLCMAAN
jgi:ADP-dependent phosphofructokinase/glucokinase